MIVRYDIVQLFFFLLLLPIFNCMPFKLWWFKVHSTFERLEIIVLCRHHQIWILIQCNSNAKVGCKFFCDITQWLLGISKLLVSCVPMWLFHSSFFFNESPSFDYYICVVVRWNALLILPVLWQCADLDPVYMAVSSEMQGSFHIQYLVMCTHLYLGTTFIWSSYLSLLQVDCLCCLINPLWSSDTIWQHRTGPNIGSGNGLLLDDTKLLPEPVFIYIIIKSAQWQ